MKINNYSNNNLIFARKKQQKTEEEAIQEYSKTHLSSPITAVVASVVTMEAMSIASKKIPPKGIFIPVIIAGIGTLLDMSVGEKISKAYKDNEEKRQTRQTIYDACISGIIAPVILYSMDKIKEVENINGKNIKSWSSPKIMLPVAILGAICGVISGNYSEKLYKKFFNLNNNEIQKTN
jgi:Na+/H+-translocating membrane pyrophosphatase